MLLTLLNHLLRLWYYHQQTAIIVMLSLQQRLWKAGMRINNGNVWEVIMNTKWGHPKKFGSMVLVTVLKVHTLRRWIMIHVGLQRVNSPRIHWLIIIFAIIFCLPLGPDTAHFRIHPTTGHIFGDPAIPPAATRFLQEALMFCGPYFLMSVCTRDAQLGFRSFHSIQRWQLRVVLPFWGGKYAQPQGY